MKGFTCSPKKFAKHFHPLQNRKQKSMKQIQTKNLQNSQQNFLLAFKVSFKSSYPIDKKI